MHLGVFQESSTRQIIVDLEESDNVWRQGCIHRLHKYVKVSYFIFFTQQLSVNTVICHLTNIAT